MNFPLACFPKLETKRLLLRQETLEDALAVFAVFSDPKVTQFHDLDTFKEITEAIGVIERRTERFKNGRGIRWVIARQQDNILIGSIGFNWDEKLNNAEVGYELASAFWRQGIMTEAMHFILKFGFEELELKSIVAEVMLGNTASKKLLNKLGFQSQGILEKRGFWKGQYHDLEKFVLTTEMSTQRIKLAQ
ncbi:MAG: GNAT family protein [Aulosira sp. DedQUE10]|nr:GNAT family protein [Aulosira sp. DedQUE10]